MKRPRATIIPVIFMTSFLQDGLTTLCIASTFTGVGFNASVFDHEAQEKSRGYTEDALGQIELPL
jgi:hypothetical protein